MYTITQSVAETAAFGLQLAKKTHGGDIFSLIGDLGGGKTSFVKGFARGFGISDLVSSPSFILMKVYSVSHPVIKHLCHVDAYRLHSPDEIIEVGLNEYLGRPDTITLIEWADKMPSLLATFPRTELRFTFIDDTTRTINTTKKPPTT